MKLHKKILEEYELPEGLKIDIAEGWKKITSRQFGGDPGRGFGELIQNLIDSYPDSVPMDQRKGEIKTTDNSISITDFGEGFTREKIKLIITLGGSDKTNDKTKIGQFGIGFFSIFNSSLGTTKVVVKTKCDGFCVQISFIISSPNELPLLKMEVVDEETDFSTKIDVTFKYSGSVDKCIKYAKESLKYYPCRITINGQFYNSVWEEAKNQNWQFFDDSYCNGFIKPNGYRNWVTVLCKYEYIIQLSLNSLLRGTESPTYNLEDYKAKGFPYIDGHETIVNSNYLSLTISRDSFYLNYNYTNMLNSMTREYFKLLSNHSLKGNDQLILANIYIFSYEIGQYLKTGKIPDAYSEEKKIVVKNLSEAPVFNVSGKRNPYSLKALKQMLSTGLPFFYSPNKINTRWLGGAFKHDYVVLPERCHLENGARDFYKSMFTSVFDDIVDLDRIQGNNKMIESLVERGIVSPETLSPKVDFVGEKRISNAENMFLEEINQILKNPEIINAIEENLYLSVSSIKAIFFEIQNEGAYISTGIFDQNMAPVKDNYISNFERKDKTDENIHIQNANVLLGLRKDHPLIRQLISSDNSHKAYFALTYIAHELAFCQRLLVPYSSFFHFTREKLASDMRKALMISLFKRAA
jgi:hypothetical protein